MNCALDNLDWDWFLQVCFIGGGCSHFILYYLASIHLNTITKIKWEGSFKLRVVFFLQ